MLERALGSGFGCVAAWSGVWAFLRFGGYLRENANQQSETRE